MKGEIEINLAEDGFGKVSFSSVFTRTMFSVPDCIWPTYLQSLFHGGGTRLDRLISCAKVNRQPNLASINITKLSAFPIPFPPASEQHQIVAEVERRLSVIDELEATVETNLTRADRLRQAILSQAFSGKLVRNALQERSA
ncbi:MAG: hypothetical protein CV088_15625 [Nitrospira sp. LK70]|nr:hypothetical protein [Nitrospira sp. LK70]